MNSTKLIFPLIALVTLTACGAQVPSWMPGAKKQVPQVVLGERKRPEMNDAAAKQIPASAAGQQSSTEQALPQPTIWAQTNAGVMPPAEMQKKAPQEGWADQEAGEAPKERKGLFGFFKKGSDTAKAPETTADSSAKRVPALNSEAPASAAAPLAPVITSPSDNKEFPKLSSVPESPKPVTGKDQVQANIKEMEKSRDEMKAETASAPAVLPPAQSTAGAPANEPIAPLPQIAKAEATPQSAPITQGATEAPVAKFPKVSEQPKPEDGKPVPQIQRVEVPDATTQVMGAPIVENPAPVEPIVLTPPSSVARNNAVYIPESRYATRRARAN